MQGESSRCTEVISRLSLAQELGLMAGLSVCCTYNSVLRCIRRLVPALTITAIFLTHEGRDVKDVFQF